MLWLRSNGVALHGLAPIGDLKYTFTWGSTGGGLQSIEWAMSLPVGYTHPALRKGALVELMAGPVTLGWASLEEPDREGWSFVADGLYRMGEHIAAVGSSLSAIVTDAAARDWPWRNPGDLPAAALGPEYVSGVLSQHCELNGKRWWVDAERYVRVGDDPTAVTWALMPGTPGMAVADDDYASRLYGRYISGLDPEGEPIVDPVPSTAEDPAAAARWGRSEHFVDQTPLGPIDSATSETLLLQMLAAGKARPAFTQAVELTRGRVTTPGGASPELWQVAASVGSGVKVRHHGILDSEGAPVPGGTLEWVAGSATHDVAAKTLTLGPVGLAPRTLSQVLTVQARETAAA